MNILGKLVSGAVLATSLVSSACIIESDEDSSLEVFNDSDYIMDELNVAPVGQISWGPDLLRGQALYPDESVLIFLDCGDYDLRIIDEHGHTCVIGGLDLCFDDEFFRITNADLDHCTL